jgi:hypothetical protein
MMQAYITWVGDEPPRWSAHTERSEHDPTGVEVSEHATVEEAVAWARGRTDWALVSDGRQMWAGSPDKQPPDVPELLRG